MLAKFFIWDDGEADKLQKTEGFGSSSAYLIYQSNLASLIDCLVLAPTDSDDDRPLESE